MGRKKPFIDKSKAVTYHVIYKDHDDSEEPFEFVSADDIRQRTEESAEAASARHPLSFLYENEEDQVQSEEQRQEIINMGLPDDGYNYLKHMRAPGARPQMVVLPASVPEEKTLQDNELNQAAKPEPLLFVPPPEDVRFFDASAMPVCGTDDQQDTAQGRLDTVSAFLRPIYHADKVAKLASITEVTAMMAALDEDDALLLEAEGCAPEAILGDGDLLDDFVESAQQAAESHDAPHCGMLPPEGQHGHDTASETLSEGAPDLVRRSPASIADSFWRKERLDRTDAHTIIDERLIARMDLEYGDDDIGSLEDEEHATRSGHAWNSSDVRLQKVLMSYSRNGGPATGAEGAEALDAQARSRSDTAAAVHPEGAKAPSSSAHTEPQDDAAVARAKALEAAEQYACAAQTHDGSSDGDHDGDLAAMVLAPRPVPEDCESVLSCCSTAYNHPGRISDEQQQQQKKKLWKGGSRPGGAAAVAASGVKVQLSRKTGLPLGVLGAVGAAALGGVSEEEGGEGDWDRGSDVDSGGFLGGGGQERVNLGVGRGKSESADGKKARKGAVKETKRAARLRKKDSKQVFSAANTSMKHHVASNGRAQRTVVHIV